jgi:ribosomal protein S27E
MTPEGRGEEEEEPMNDEPTMLVCTRLADMTVMHPDQSWDLCHECGHVVGVYPTGQRVIKEYPKMKVVCSDCANTLIEPGDEVSPAGSVEEITQERNESKPVWRA